MRKTAITVAALVVLGSVAFRTLAPAADPEKLLKVGDPFPTWSLGDHTAAVNDVGVITLPGGGGRVAIAVLIRDVRGPVPRAEKTIAEVAKAVFDSWNAPE